MRTDVNVGIFVAIIAAIFIGWLLMRTKVGYEMRAVGLTATLRDSFQYQLEKPYALHGYFWCTLRACDYDHHCIARHYNAGGI